MGTISGIDSTQKVEFQLRPLIPEKTDRSTASAKPTTPATMPGKASDTDVASAKPAKMQEMPQEETTKRLRASVDQLSTRFTDLQIVMDDRYSGVVVKIVRRDSGELVRQIPSEEFLNLHSKLGDAKGILMSENV